MIIITIVKITTITIVLMIKRTSASALRESIAQFRGFPASQRSGPVGVGAPGGIFIIVGKSEIIVMIILGIIIIVGMSEIIVFIIVGMSEIIVMIILGIIIIVGKSEIIVMIILGIIRSMNIISHEMSNMKM